MQITINSISFIKNHLLLPLIAFVVLLLCMEFTQLDLWLASHFYNTELKLWPYREHWLTQTVLHKAGRYIVYTIGVMLLLCWLTAFRSKSALSGYRKHLTFLLLASLAGPLIITYLKSHTHIYCPWDLALFGGNKPHIRLFDAIDNRLTVGHCFPSGHSGLGFTFVSLYFFFLLVKPIYKYHGLVAGLVAGFIFGINQEIRGAHFFSHDVFALAICWFSSLLLFMIFFCRQFK
ncbi:phosphatase PAP2 family protein [Methyloglobulus sp.]|uniref:phosphatase PAP2 family protein n=1 Tax=Methyloglobulus sp. TaxID=2518622 RepID=UPI0032B84F47